LALRAVKEGMALRNESFEKMVIEKVLPLVRQAALFKVEIKGLEKGRYFFGE
jgi:hypothetical protein